MMRQEVEKECCFLMVIILPLPSRPWLCVMYSAYSSFHTVARIESLLISLLRSSRGCVGSGLTQLCSH